jgi:hypothetical protein
VTRHTGEGGLEHPVWPDEIARRRAPFYGIRTAGLLANESRWVHRRVERLELLDERRARRHISVDLTLPNLASPPWTADGDDAQIWLVPIALLRRGLLTSLDVRSAAGASLPVLTREQNSAVAFELLASLAEETLAEAFGEGTPLDQLVRRDLGDVAGARRGDADHPGDIERGRRTTSAVSRFRRSAARAARGGVPFRQADDQRQALWRDSTMRGFITMLAERFVLLVPMAARPGTRTIVKLSYEQALEVSPIVAAMERSLGKRRDRAVRFARGLIGRAAASFGVRSNSFRAQTRAVFGPESYHVEIAAPDELLIEYASLERTTTVRSVDTPTEHVNVRRVAEDRCTERAHLYESLYTSEEARATPASANEETTTVSAITVYFFMRPSFVRPAFMIGFLTSAMLSAGLVLKAVGVSRTGDVTALIVVLPAIFAAYLIPGEHRLVRRMFRGLRFLVFLLSVISFVAAGTLTVTLASSTRLILWVVLLVLALVSTVTIGTAYWTSIQKEHARS